MSQHAGSTSSKLPDDSLPLEHAVGWPVTPLLKSRQQRSMPAGGHKLASVRSQSLRQKSRPAVYRRSMWCDWSSERLGRSAESLTSLRHSTRSVSCRARSRGREANGNAPSLMPSTTKTSTKENGQLSCAPGSETAAAGCTGAEKTGGSGDGQGEMEEAYRSVMIRSRPAPKGPADPATTTDVIDVLSSIAGKRPMTE